MYELRLFLSKQGRIKYVSHLDMFRIMQRAVRRAEIPLWYTEGFNPHPYISFLLALSLGVESKGEPVDIKIVGNMTPQEVKDRLNATLPEGLRVESASAPFNKSSEIEYAEYDINFYSDEITEKELFEALSSGTLTCEKRCKQGRKKVMKTVDVSSHIKKFSLKTEGDYVRLNIILPAGSTFNLNPGQLSEAVSAFIGREVTPASSMRNMLLCGDMTRFS